MLVVESKRMLFKSILIYSNCYIKKPLQLNGKCQEAAPSFTAQFKFPEPVYTIFSIASEKKLLPPKKSRDRRVQGLIHLE